MNEAIKMDLIEYRSRYQDGVRGSFVLDSAGAVVAHELPGKLEGAKLAPDIRAIYRALAPVVRRSKSKEHNIILRFDTIMIYCRRIRGGMLVVLAAHDANVTNLRAISNLYIDDIETHLGEGIGRSV